MPAAASASAACGIWRRAVVIGPKIARAFCPRTDSAADARVDLVEQRVLVVEVEVLRQVPRGLVARRAVQRHVEGDQPCALGAADRPAAATRLGGRLGLGGLL